MEVVLGCVHVCYRKRDGEEKVHLWGLELMKDEGPREIQLWPRVYACVGAHGCVCVYVTNKGAHVSTRALECERVHACACEHSVSTQICE